MSSLSYLTKDGTHVLVWKYSKDKKSITHDVCINGTYNPKKDTYALRFRQNPWGTRKGAKIIEFVINRQDMDNFLQILKLESYKPNDL